MNKYSLMKVTAGEHGDVRHAPLYPPGDDMFDILTVAADMAAKERARVEVRAYNRAIYSWDYILTFNPDGTADNGLGEHLRFTFDRHTWWEKA